MDGSKVNVVFGGFYVSICGGCAASSGGGGRSLRVCGSSSLFVMVARLFVVVAMVVGFFGGGQCVNVLIDILLFVLNLDYLCFCCVG